MRTRPSGSLNDESDINITTHNTLTKAEKSRGMVKETPRAVKQSLKTLHRNTSREPDASPSLAQVAVWPSTSTSDPGNERDAMEGDARNKESAQLMTETFRRQRARLRGAWSCSFLTLATTACSIILLGIIVRSFHTLQLDPKGCAMSYMRPAFAHFSDFDTEYTRFGSKYSLYLYREGGVDEDTRVKGIPVIFIPGNAGSYKQVRPIAAEAAHYFQDVLREDMAAMANGKRPLDFFTVDFNEELSAFHGQTLLDQAEYLNEAVAYILALYHSPHRSLRESSLPEPKSVMILGHSMGGIVGRTMLRMPNYQEKTVNTIFTLSAPHARAPISFDSEMVATYNDINTFWRRSYSAISPHENPLSDVTLVSVAGGGLDTMIPSEYSSLTSLVPDTHGFTVFTSAIPCVWTGMDHLAIMWCDQFRKALVKAIFDVADVRRASQTLEQSARIKALRKRLLTGMESVVEKANLDDEPTTILALEHSATSVTPPGERLVLRSLGHDAKTRVHLMPIPAQPLAQNSIFTLLSSQRLDDADDNGTLTALLCSVFPASSDLASAVVGMDANAILSDGGLPRLACKNAASDVSFLPASTNESSNAFDDTRPFSYLQYNLSDLHDYQFIAIVEQPAEHVPGWVIAQFSAAAESSIKISRGHHELLVHGLHQELPPGRPMMTELKIPEVHSTMFAYNLHVTRHSCDETEELFTPLLRQYIQEPYESKYFVNTQGGNINVHGISPYMPPPLNGKGATEGLSLQLWSDPTCNSTVEVSLTVDVIGSAGKLVMRYRTVLAVFPLLVVAIVLRKQFQVYDTTGVFMSFSQSMDHCIRTSLPAVVAALTFLSIALSKASQAPWTRLWFSQPPETGEGTVDFAVNDLMLGTSDPFFWFLVPLFGVLGVGVCIAFNYFVLTVTEVIVFLYDRFAALGLRADDARQNAPSLAMTSPHRRIITTGVLLLMIATVIPYQFAYIVLCFIQAGTCVRALRVARDNSTGQSYNFYNYAHSMLVLMLWILPINMPVLVVWIHNLAARWLTPFSIHHNLLSVLPYILLVETMSTGNMVPRMTGRARYITNILMFSFALYAAVYGMTYAYRLHHMVNALCAWLLMIHACNGRLSLASVAQYLPRARSEGCNVKKRP